MGLRQGGLSRTPIYLNKDSAFISPENEFSALLCGCIFDSLKKMFNP